MGKDCDIPHIDWELLGVFENQTWVDVIVKYKGDIPVTFENEEEMLFYYLDNKTIVKEFFGYIPETEMKNAHGGLSALQPSFTTEVTKKGFDMLVNDSRVTKIYLETAVYELQEESVSENKTEITTLPITTPKSFFQVIINFFRYLFGKKK